MKLLIVDDEPLARERLKALVGEVGGHEVAGEAANGREAVEQAEALGVDIVLLDISMPVMDGLEAAQHLAGLRPAPAVVFCTAYDQHALAAFEAAAVDYLVKPVRRERLAEALERANISVGASIAPCIPASTAFSSAISATSVLPEPTSPCKSRFIRSGFSISSAISPTARVWAAVGA